MYSTEPVVTNHIAASDEYSDEREPFAAPDPIENPRPKKRQKKASSNITSNTVIISISDDEDDVIAMHDDNDADVPSEQPKQTSNVKVNDDENARSDADVAAHSDDGDVMSDASSHESDESSPKQTSGAHSSDNSSDLSGLDTSRSAGSSSERPEMLQSRPTVHEEFDSHMSVEPLSGATSLPVSTSVSTSSVSSSSSSAPSSSSRPSLTPTSDPGVRSRAEVAASLRGNSPRPVLPLDTSLPPPVLSNCKEEGGAMEASSTTTVSAAHMSDPSETVGIPSVVSSSFVATTAAVIPSGTLSSPNISNSSVSIVTPLSSRLDCDSASTLTSTLVSPSTAPKDSGMFSKASGMLSSTKASGSSSAKSATEIEAELKILERLAAEVNVEFGATSFDDDSCKFRVTSSQCSDSSSDNTNTVHAQVVDQIIPPVDPASPRYDSESGPRLSEESSVADGSGKNASRSDGTTSSVHDQSSEDFVEPDSVNGTNGAGVGDTRRDASACGTATSAAVMSSSSVSGKSSSTVVESESESQDDDETSSVDGDIDIELCVDGDVVPMEDADDDEEEEEEEEEDALADFEDY